MSESKPPPNLDEVMKQFGGIFEQMFGGAGGVMRGEDIRLDLELSYPEARDGTKRDVAFERWVMCNPCKGTGGAPARRGQPAVRIPCPDCVGNGTTTVGGSMFTCKRCKGRKDIPDVACSHCTDGRIKRGETVTVTVPAGIETGQTLRLPGMGCEHVSGTKGHLFLSITVDVENVVRREGTNAVIEVPVGLRHAMFGGAMQVQTLDGPATIRIPRRCFDGEIITIPGAGFARAGGHDDPYRGGSRGDHKVVLRVSHEVRKQRDLIRYSVVVGILVIIFFALSHWR